MIPTDDARIFLQLQRDMAPWLHMLGAAADTILDQDVSRYPIFITHRLEELELGIPLLQHDPATPWSVHVSTLEELATKRLVDMTKVDDFRRVYRDPQDFLCLFVLDGQDARFVFMPRHSVPS